MMGNIYDDFLWKIANIKGKMCKNGEKGKNFIVIRDKNIILEVRKK